MHQIFDVAIVGYGPTGATLANLLVEQGLQVLVIDREAKMYHLPRSVHFDDETMRVFQTAGIAEALTEYVHVNPGMKFQDNNGNLLLNWPRTQEITSHGWNASYRLHQPDLETLLRGRIKKYDGAHEVLNHEVRTATERNEHVTLGCINRKTKRPTEFRAKFVVGCDGANSIIRNTIGDGMQDLGFHERWLVIDLILKEPRPDLGDHSIQFCDPQRPMTYCRSAGARRRWEVSVLDDESDTDICKPERVWELLARWIKPDQATLERSVVYTFRSAIAHRWRKGRLMIAGDAAHLTPPFMGQGMCTGIRDVANLGWKLQLVLQTDADKSLLDTYQSERSRHAKEYIQTAIRLGGLINSLDRQSAMQMAQDQNDGKTTIKSIQPKLGASSHMQSHSDQHGDPVGRPFAQPWLNGGTTRFDDFVGYRHAVVSRKRIIPPDGVLNVSAQDHPSLRETLDKLKVSTVWVRPDRYIAAASDTPEAVLDIITNSNTRDGKSE